MSIKNIPSKHLLYMTLILILHIALAFILDLPIYIGIIASILYVFYIAIRYGYKAKELLLLYKDSLKTVRIVLCMLILISAILPLWMASGTLPTLIHYSFIYLSELNVPLAAFLISTILSLMLGTFIGTLSILGPLFMSLSVGLHIPPALIASALISGSVIGDRLSPISSNFHLICASCGAEINKTMLALIKTNGLAFVITCLFYFAAGQRYQLDFSGRQNIQHVLHLLDTHFTIHYLMILPIILLLLMIISKQVAIVLSFFITFIASLASYIIVGLDASGLPSLIIKGYHPTIEALHHLISGSGILSMIAVPIIILLSAYLNDLLKYTHLMTHALYSFTSKDMTTRAMYHRTALLSAIVTIISCNQSLTAIITGQHFQPFFDKKAIDRSLLARTIADTGSLIITIIPWNLNAVVSASITGVTTLTYAPYMIYVYALLAITIGFPLFLSDFETMSVEKTTL